MRINIPFMNLFIYVYVDLKNQQVQVVGASILLEANLFNQSAAGGK